jgi:hypothetical protein
MTCAVAGDARPSTIAAVGTGTSLRPERGRRISDRDLPCRLPTLARSRGNANALFITCPNQPSLTPVDRVDASVVNQKRSVPFHDCDEWRKSLSAIQFVCIIKRRHCGGVNAAPLRPKNVLANANLFSGVLGRGKLRIYGCVGGRRAVSRLHDERDRAGRPT